ncbi:MAG: hypothetical protein C0483_20075 [Pirellula sp.]|nr:hypothetical protein [Pirellula sp.]
MPQKVSCVGCGRTFQVRDELGGKTGKCPTCGGAVPIPIRKASDPTATPSAPLPTSTTGIQIVTTPRVSGAAKGTPLATRAQPRQKKLLFAVVALVLVGVATGIAVWALQAGSSAVPQTANTAMSPVVDASSSASAPALSGDTSVATSPNPTEVVDRADEWSAAAPDENRLERSVELCRKAIDEVVAKYGASHASLGALYQEYSRALERASDFSAARDAAQKAIAILEKTLGEGHPETANAYGTLAMIQGLLLEPGAYDSMNQSRKILRNFTIEVLPAYSEQERATFTVKFDRPLLEKTMSLLLTEPKAPVPNPLVTAGWFVNGKGAAAEAAQGFAWAEKDEKLRETATKLRGVRGELAKRMLTPLAELASGGEHIADVARLRKEEAELRAQLAAASGNTQRWVEAEEVMKALPPRTALVEFVKIKIRPRGNLLGPYGDGDHYVACLLTRKTDPNDLNGNYQFLDIGPADKIDDVVATIHQRLSGVGPRSTQGEAGAELEFSNRMEEMLSLHFHVLLNELEQYDHWIIAPDSDLWMIPWAVLPLQSGRYAVQEHSITIVTSSRELVLKKSSSSEAPSLVVGSPNYGLGVDGAGDMEGPFNELPGTRREVLGIAPQLERLSGTKPVVLLDDEATERRLREARGPSTLVLSTHGFYFPGGDVAVPNPLLRGGLALAGANDPAAMTGEKDGILTSWEASQLDLRGTRLVVLSACQTGVGEIRNGEGVAGLRHAFHLAGADTVLSTLWSIPDQETAVLMQRFFQLHAAGDDPATALRGAQLAAIEDRRTRFGGSHPLMWGAFQVATHIPPASDLEIREAPPRAALFLKQPASSRKADGLTYSYYSKKLHWWSDDVLILEGKNEFYVINVAIPHTVQLDAAGMPLAFAAAHDGRWFAHLNGGRNFIWRPAPRTPAGATRESIDDVLPDVSSAEFSPDGKRLAMSDRISHVRIVSTEGPRNIVDAKVPKSNGLVLSFHPDGNSILVDLSSDELALIDVATGAITHRWTVTGEPRSFLRAANFTPDGTQVVVGFGRHLRLHDATTGRVVREFEHHAAMIRDIDFSPDGKSFAVATGSGISPTPVFIFNLSEPALQRQLDGLRGAGYSVAYSPDGKRIAATAGARGIYVWNLDDAAK